MGATHLNGKTVLITGGTGTFGRAMVAHLLSKSRARRVIVLSRDEHKQNDMRRDFPDGRLSFFLGDIRDPVRLHRALNGVDIVIHAAALKQVPALEYNPSEAIETNIAGTKNVIDAAHDRNVGEVLVISSDKAVQPVNLYGATKLCAERLAIASNSYRGKGRTKISVVRYGNVIGSRGSLLELIEKQRASGVITLTDERMTRFWIHIDDIMHIVTDILAVMEGGEIFVPKMMSLRVVDVMKAVAPECKVKTIGIRPGEKLHEALLTEHEARRTKDLGAVLVVLPEFRSWDSKEPFAKRKSFPHGAEYVSDNPKFLLSVKDVKKVLKL